MVVQWTLPRSTETFQIHADILTSVRQAILLFLFCLVYVFVNLINLWQCISFLLCLIAGWTLFGLCIVEI